MRRYWNLLIAAIVPMCVSTGHAATITKVDRPACRYLLQGDIAAGDFDLLKSSISERESTLCLDSMGGSYKEGLNIAEYLVGRNITTVLDANAKCFSSCAIIFMGGSDLEEIYLSKRNMHITASLGFHAPYLVLDDRQYDALHVKVAYKAGLEAVARMIKLGDGFIPNHVILSLLQKGPDEAYLVDTVAKAKALKIRLFGFRFPGWSAQSACNACMTWNENTSSCEASHAKVSKVNSTTTQFLFLQSFGAEASQSCAVRITQDKKGQLSGSIAPTLDDQDFPIRPNAFRFLEDYDALSPDMPIGR